jgi:glucuronosyltransferase
MATFTDDELKEKLTKLLTDQSYQNNIHKQSQIASDQPLSPLDTAIYWIEYVIRHNGAPHLHYSSVDMPFYQYYLLDVYLLIGVIVVLLYYIIKRLAVIVVLTVRVLKRLIISRILGLSETSKKQL